MYPYSTLDSFWVADDEEHNPKLLVKSQKTLMPLISIPLGEADPEIIHNYLIQFIDDEQHEESFARRASHPRRPICSLRRGPKMAGATYVNTVTYDRKQNRSTAVRPRGRTPAPASGKSRILFPFSLLMPGTDRRMLS